MTWTACVYPATVLCRCLIRIYRTYLLRKVLKNATYLHAQRGSYTVIAKPSAEFPPRKLELPNLQDSARGRRTKEVSTIASFFPHNLMLKRTQVDEMPVPIIADESAPLSGMEDDQIIIWLRTIDGTLRDYREQVAKKTKTDSAKLGAGNCSGWQRRPLYSTNNLRSTSTHSCSASNVIGDLCCWAWRPASAWRRSLPPERRGLYGTRWSQPHSVAPTIPNLYDRPLRRVAVVMHDL